LYEGRAVASLFEDGDGDGPGLTSFLLSVVVDDVTSSEWNATVVGTTPGDVLVGRRVRVRLLDTPGRRAAALGRFEGTHCVVGSVPFSELRPPALWRSAASDQA
jgi:hypothetical protein